MRVSVVLLLVGFPALAAEGVDDKQKAELKKLEGTWVHVSTERNGEKRPEPRALWIFEGNRARVYYLSRPANVDPKNWTFEPKPNNLTLTTTSNSTPHRRQKPSISGRSTKAARP